MVAPAHPSATVILLRDGEAGLEVLLLQRNAALAFHGGDWVFPGGRVDADDRGPGDGDLEAAARAAAREAEEEAGIVLEPDALVPFARWITPEILPKRFATYFFAGSAGDQAVSIDGGEIHDARWMRPEDALAAQARGALGLPPPTFVTLWGLRGERDAATALARYEAMAIEVFRPRPAGTEGGWISLYEGDAGYETSDPAVEGPRHRLWVLDAGWRYEKEGP